MIRSIRNSFLGGVAKPRRVFWCTTIAFFVAVSTSLQSQVSARPTSFLASKVDLSIRESFDSNVYLQDKDPSLPGAFPAQRDSWVTTLIPRLSIGYGDAESQINGFYAPEISFYHSARSEDNIAHKLGLTLTLQRERMSFEQANSFVWIDGSKSGPIFAPPQDIPAVGGIPLRDRRDAIVYRGSIKVGWELGNFLIRPVGAAYIHDFKTHQKLPSVTQPLIYVNYNDRRDVNFGFDLGYRAMETTRLLIGYRFGVQDQFRGVSVFDPTRFADSPYDSYYHRFLVGMEGSPVPWLKVNFLFGPEIRDWRRDTPVGFDRGELLYWLDCSATLQFSAADTLTLVARRFEQPAFTSQSVYEDITYSINLKHRFNPELAATIGFQVYVGDWQAPVNREDWIYTPSLRISWQYDKNWLIEASYCYDWVDNKVPTSTAPSADGREYTRHIVTLTIKYSF